MVLLESKITLKTGDSAPDFSLKGIDDQIHSLGSYAQSKGLLIIFMCNQCPYVKAKIDAIKQIHEKGQTGELVDGDFFEVFHCHVIH